MSKKNFTSKGGSVGEPLGDWGVTLPNVRVVLKVSREAERTLDSPVFVRVLKVSPAVVVI